MLRVLTNLAVLLIIFMAVVYGLPPNTLATVIVLIFWGISLIFDDAVKAVREKHKKGVNNDANE